MALSNSQYDALIHEYEIKQFENRQRALDRQRELYEHIPELHDLDEQAASLSVQSVIANLESDSKGTDTLHTQLEEIKTKRMRLIREAGYPSNYLEEVYDCPDCKDTGFINNEKCHCFKQKIINMVYSQSHLGDILEKENFNTFSFEYYDNKSTNPKTGLTPFESAKIAYDKCRDFVHNFANEGGNLLLQGTTGVGKTFLSNCVAKELLDQGFSVIYFTASELFKVFEDQTFKRNVNVEDLHDQIFDCDLLIIDDLGTEFPNNFTITKLFQCLNERLLRNKSTVISTNLSLEEMRDTYSERITSRVFSYYDAIRLIGDDIRIKKVMLNK
jgi:DNA replication protein DnaC